MWRPVRFPSRGLQPDLALVIARANSVLRSGDLSVHAADDQIGDADVVAHHVPDRIVAPTLVDDLDRLELQSLGIGVDRIDDAAAPREAGLARGVVLMDAGYGAETDLRTNITTLGLSYVAGTRPNTTIWPSGMAPLPPKRWSGRGRPPKLMRRDGKHQPISVKQLALELPKRAWRTIKWREGTAEWLSSRFARVRVRIAHRDYQLTQGRPEEWLLIEWPEGEDEPTKYWLSTLAKDISFRRLIDIAKLRWRIERDYQELKQEFGLGHLKGVGGAASITTPRCALQPTDS